MSLFTGLLDGRFAISEKPIERTPPALFPEEASCIAKAVEKRRREFFVGRLCAHNALSELGAPPAALLPGHDRAPIWPMGFTGSITHTDRYCAAAVATKSAGVQTVGIDLEPAEALPRDLWETVCRPEERTWLAALPAEERGLLARAVFCAKECAFKAQFPITRALLEFEDIGIDIDLPRETFVATFLRSAPETKTQGRIRFANGFVACALFL